MGQETLNCISWMIWFRNMFLLSFILRRYFTALEKSCCYKACIAEGKTTTGNVNIGHQQAAVGGRLYSTNAFHTVGVRWSIKTGTYYFYIKFDKCRPILIILSLLHSAEEGGINLPLLHESVITLPCEI